jgi:hypothetical protein
MKWHRQYPKLASFEQRIKLEPFYVTETDFGEFRLLRRHATRRGRTYKYKAWMLWNNGKPVSGSTRYKLCDAKAFAERHLEALRASEAEREARRENYRMNREGANK